MRLWTVHPRYLDSRGLVAVWREGLLALKVLQGRTRGYRHHPQLNRFRETTNPVAYIAQYLREIYAEAVARDYHFDPDKIPKCHAPKKNIQETHGQLIYEWNHLMNKLKLRQPELHKSFKSVRAPDHHPLFRIVPGPAKEPL